MDELLAIGGLIWVFLFMTAVVWFVVVPWAILLIASRVGRIERYMRDQVVAEARAARSLKQPKPKQQPQTKHNPIVQPAAGSWTKKENNE